MTAWQGVAPLIHRNQFLCQFKNKFCYEDIKPELSTPIKTRDIFGKVGRVSKSFEKHMGFHKSRIFIRPTAIQSAGRFIHLSRNTNGKLWIQDISENLYRAESSQNKTISLTAVELRALGTFLGTSKNTTVNWQLD